MCCRPCRSCTPVPEIPIGHGALPMAQRMYASPANTYSRFCMLTVISVIALSTSSGIVRCFSCLKKGFMCRRHCWYVASVFFPSAELASASLREASSSSHSLSSCLKWREICCSGVTATKLGASSSSIASSASPPSASVSLGFLSTSAVFQSVATESSCLSAKPCSGLRSASASSCFSVSTTALAARYLSSRSSSVSPNSWIGWLSLRSSRFTSTGRRSPELRSEAACTAADCSRAAVSSASSFFSPA
mmetsp:Transcript_32638/g.81246  ORF Transcript_32638/g.81246 Transcript_32638/m.81246 type:complete len:248 (-) Transcript_32638:149-892(-)